MLDAIVAAAGEPAARLTTVGAWVAGRRVVAPDPTREFLTTVEAAVDRGVRTLALEMTSKALATGLASRWPAHVAVFTNLSRDHLDYHPSPEAYLAAKAQLFLALPSGGVAVLNGDDPASALIAEVVPAHATVQWFAGHGATAALAAEAVRVDATGTGVTLVQSPLAAALGGDVQLRVHGRAHAQNALAAAVAATALGYPPAAIRRGLEAFAGVPGRFEIVRRGPTVVVDYAHTPEALEGTLRTARGFVPSGSRLWCVFGCGGGRDRGKRPVMGAVADRLADRVVVTSDNPRAEPPATIIADIRRGVSAPAAHWSEVVDRRAAIAYAIQTCGDDDVVVLAGRGHETEQEVASGRVPLCDATFARAVSRPR